MADRELATYSLDGRIATITMDDGKANVFSIEMLTALDAAFDRAEADKAIVVLRGREGTFSAGFDLKVIRTDPERVGEMIKRGALLAERVLTFPTPVLTVCTGHCYPAGAFLLMAADARIGVEGPFRLGLNETRIGLPLPWFAIEMARHRMPVRAFDRTVVNAVMFSPTEAIDAGLLDAVVPADQLDATVAAWTADLAELDPKVHASTKLKARQPAITAVREAIVKDFGSD